MQAVCKASKPPRAYVQRTFGIDGYNNRTEMAAALADIRLKRAYDPSSEEDGARVLVDRLWPRGLTKDELHAMAWLRDLSPSNQLRKWFHAHPDQWAEFRRRYLLELKSPETAKTLDQLHKLVQSHSTVTLLFASKQLERNNATVLKELVERNLAARQP